MEKSGKIKLMILTSVLDKRGAERMIMKLALGLDPDRYDVRVVCLRPRTPFLAEFESRGIKVDVLGMKKYFQLRPLIELYRLFRRRRPDLVHTHLYRDAVYGRVIARLAGVRGVVSTLHNSYVWRSKAQLFLDRLTAIFADRITAVSDAVKMFAVNREHIPAGTITTVYNGIETELFRVRPEVRERVRKELGLNPKNIAIGSMGELTRQKGYRYLLEAAPAVLESHPGVRFFIAGGGELKESLVRLRDQAGLGDRFVFLGFRDDVPELLSSFDIFVLPSIYEGLPVSLIEAMAAGLAIVTTDVDGNCEVIGGNEAGLPVESQNPAALTQSLIKLIESPELRGKMGEAGRRRARNLFSIESMIDSYEKIYRDCLK